MTIRGRTQAYSVGNKVYGAGRSNPTSGPVDKLGYRERDARKMMLTNAMQQALSKRIPNKTTASSAHPITLTKPFGTQPESTGQYKIPIRSAPVPASPISEATGDMSANTSTGKALTDAQRNAQEAQNRWDVAHGMQPVYYDQMFSQPYTEINGQVVPNPSYRGPAVPYTGPGAVNGHTPQQAAQEAATKAQGQGIEGLGYDPAYSQFLAQYQLQNSQAAQALFNAQHTAQANAGVTDRNIDNQAQDTYRQLIDNYAGRGLAFSGSYGGAYGNAQNDVANQHASNQQNLTNLLNSLQTNYSDVIGSGQQDLQTAMQAYIASLANGAGSLGLASGNAVTGPNTDVTNEQIAAILRQLMGVNS